MPALTTPVEGPLLVAAVPTGTPSYYRDRHDDFLRRHPTGQPPTYYLAYGDRCLQQFLRAEPTMTPPGRAWLRGTMWALQEMVEGTRLADPEAFDVLERDDDEFHDFAFSLHAPAYLEAGLFELPVDDLWRIIRTPDLSDLVTPDGLQAIAHVVAAARPHDVARVATRTVRRPWRAPVGP